MPEGVKHRLRIMRDGLRRRFAFIRRSCAMNQSLRRNRRIVRGLRESAPAKPLLAIVLTEHFGDIVACEPVARHARKRFSDHTLIWIVRDAYAELVRAHPALDRTLTVTCLSEARLLTPLFDRVINLHVNRRRCTWFNEAWERSDGVTSIDVTNYLDHGSLLEAFSKAAGLEPLNEPPELFLPSVTNPAAGLPSRPYIVLHASTNEADRDWSPQKWQELVSLLQRETGADLVEVGLRPIIATPVNGVTNVCGRLGFAALADVIRGAVAFIGVESGPAHLANALRRPSIILMGHYRQWRTYMPYTGFLRDYSDIMLIRWNGRAAEIPVSTCIERLRVVCPKLFAPASAGTPRK